MLGSGSGAQVPADEAAGLEANLLLLKSPTSDGNVLFVTIDALYPGPQLRADLLRSFPEFLNEDSLFLAASHTHNAPMLDGTKPKLGKVCKSHYQSVLRKLSAAISTLQARPWLGPVTLNSHSYRVDSVVTRRRVIPIVLRRGKAFFFRAHFLPGQERSTPVEAHSIQIRLEGKGAIVGCFWVMPCHPVSYPAEDEISAHYVGVARRKFREQIAKNFEAPFIFLQGASGNLRPPAYAQGGKGTIRDWLFLVLLGRTFGRFGREDYSSWAADLADSFIATFSGSSGLERLSRPVPETDLETARKTLDLEPYFSYPKEFAREISIHQVRLGQICLVGVSGELTWNFRQQVVKRVGRKYDYIVVGCIDDSFGYITTRFEALLGGYEVDGFLPSFCLVPGAERARLAPDIRRALSDLGGRNLKKHPHPETLEQLI